MIEFTDDFVIMSRSLRSTRGAGSEGHCARVEEDRRGGEESTDDSQPPRSALSSKGLVCNPRLDGRTVRFELKKRFKVLAKMHGDDDGVPRGIRTFGAPRKFALVA
jgi:hypothetical protein